VATGQKNHLDLLGKKATPICDVFFRMSAVAAMAPVGRDGKLKWHTRWHFVREMFGHMQAVGLY
jgi:hypothetical protein